MRTSRPSPQAWPEAEVPTQTHQAGTSLPCQGSVVFSFLVPGPASDKYVLSRLLPEVKTPAHHVRNFLRCRVLRPLLRLLKHGVSPKRLAWSLAVAVVIGVNPFLGVTTLCMLFLAWLFRLNHVATQIGIHVVAPLQWLLFLPFIDAGIRIFGSRRLPMTRKEILHLSHRHPLQLIHLLWQWEWHALVVWAAFAVVVTPLIAMQIRRLLVVSLRRHRDLVLGA